jgi:uncharacterized OB-fold protein
MNNSVKDAYGEVIGFRCWTCGNVFESMWGETCNRCRAKKDETQKLRAEIRSLTEAIQNLKKAQS